MALRCACPIVASSFPNLMKFACLEMLTCGIIASAQVTTVTSAPANWSRSARVYYVELKKSLNAEKSKPGDPVEFGLLEPTLLPGRLVAPRNARLHGRVTEVQAYDRKSRQESRLSVLVDSITWKEKTVPVCATIAGFGARQVTFTRDPWSMRPSPQTSWIAQESELIAGKKSLTKLQGADGMPGVADADLFRDDPPTVVRAGEGFVKDISIARSSTAPSVLTRKNNSIKLAGGTLVALEELSPAGNACSAAVR